MNHKRMTIREGRQGLSALKSSVKSGATKESRAKKADRLLADRYLHGENQLPGRLVEAGKLLDDLTDIVAGNPVAFLADKGQEGMGGSGLPGEVIRADAGIKAGGQGLDITGPLVVVLDEEEHFI